MRPELRAILDDLPGLGSVLERAAERYVVLSRVGGTVAVEPDERRSVERLGCHVGADGRVKLVELDRAFRASRLGAPLPSVLENLRGRPLVTRDEARRREDEAWGELLARLEATDPPRWVWRWLEEEEGKLRSEWRRQAGDAPAEASWVAGFERALRAAGALEAVDASTELPRLAYRVTGDAHGLDGDRTAGRLFERLLLHRHRGAGLAPPLSAEGRESLFAMAGLTIDELSSTVHVAGLEGSAPLVAAARRGRHVLALPLRTLYELPADVRAHRDVVFAVENRSVLSALHRELADLEVKCYPTLVCTGGHLSLATLRLLDRLCAHGAVVRYSGDFDTKGLMIAGTLADRLGMAFEPWRMDVEAFEVALAARRTGRRIDPGALAPHAAEHFRDLARAVVEHGAAYQEGLTGTLLDDLRRWAAEERTPKGSPDRAPSRLTPGAPSPEELRTLVEEATVDCYDESEQVTAFYTAIEESLALPFRASVLGMDVTVDALDLSDTGEIVAVCRRDRERQRIAVLDLPRPDPPPGGWEWIEAYRYSARGMR